MLLRAPGIIALHAVTAANALHYIFDASGTPSTRAEALLQAAAWMPLYRNRLQVENDVRLDTLEPIEPTAADPRERADAVFDAVARGRVDAARTALGALRSEPDAAAFFDRARHLIARKGDDSHQYKYGAAAWEECLWATDPAHRPRLAAATLAYLPDPRGKDTSIARIAGDA
jgi:hypothetical protein